MRAFRLVIALIQTAIAAYLWQDIRRRFGLMRWIKRELPDAYAACPLMVDGMRPGRVAWFGAVSVTLLAVWQWWQVAHPS